MKQHASWEEHQRSKRAERRQAFFERLRELAGRIEACDSIDRIKLDLSRDIGALFGCERLTLYTVGASRMTIESKIKTGMDTFKNFTMPIARSSIAGHCALTRRTLNIRDVYDLEELHSHSRELHFLDAVDRRTGYRTREMVVAPVVGAGSNELLGVVQLINHRLGGPFPELVVEGVRELCKTLAVAFEQRDQPPVMVQTRFDPLVVLGMLSRPELELARRTARRKQLELEDVLIDEFQVRPAQLGAAYAQFFGVPYEPFRPDRNGSRPPEGLKRDYALHNGWLMLDVQARHLTVLALDPAHLHAARSVEQLFPGYEVQLRVCTRREFLLTLDRVYGVEADAAADAERELLQRIQDVVGRALAAAMPELQAAVRPEHVRLVRGATAADAAADGQRELPARVSLQIDLKLP